MQILTRWGNERIIKAQAYNESAREYIRYIQIMNSLYQHSQFYMMGESTLLFIPVTQSFALFLFLCVFLYHLIRQTTDSMYIQERYIRGIHIRSGNIYIHSCVYGALINELTFRDSLSSEALEWIFLYI